MDYRVCVDILAMLERELVFVERFHTRTTEPFQAIKLKIDAQEAPFTPAEIPDESGEPEYLDEWLEADHTLRILGLSALGLVEKSLHDYLRRFTMWELNALRDSDFSPYFNKLEGKGWLNKYLGFLESHGLTWATSPVPRAGLEQISLTRNDIAHSHAVTGHSLPTRSGEHISAFPTPMFADETEVVMLEGSDEPPIYIKVSGERLREAIDIVRDFCSHVDKRRTF